MTQMTAKQSAAQLLPRHAKDVRRAAETALTGSGLVRSEFSILYNYLAGFAENLIVAGVDGSHDAKFAAELVQAHGDKYAAEERAGIGRTLPVIEDRHRRVANIARHVGATLSIASASMSDRG